MKDQITKLKRDLNNNKLSTIDIKSQKALELIAQTEKNINETRQKAITTAYMIDIVDTIIDNNKYMFDDHPTMKLISVVPTTYDITLAFMVHNDLDLFQTTDKIWDILDLFDNVLNFNKFSDHHKHALGIYRATGYIDNDSIHSLFPSLTIYCYHSNKGCKITYRETTVKHPIITCDKES